MEGVLLGQTSGSNTILFLYDENGSAYGFTLNGTTYYYVFNLQGDVIGILNSAGTIVAEYTYDAWGNLLAVTGDTTLASLNPLRYRGYYYDVETGLYYVSSRYYDPEIGRFISPDTTDVLTATPMGLTDKNLFAYCDNNPVMRADHGGDFWSELRFFGEKCKEVAIVTGIIAVGVLAVGSAAVATATSGGVAAPTLVVASDFAATIFTAAVTVYFTGSVSVGIAEIGENITYANAGDGISEHTNGSKQWDKHTKKRPGDKEKGDSRRTNRIDKKKRNQNNNRRSRRR